MKIGLYTHPSTSLIIRCIDGRFDLIHLVAKNSPAATWEAVLNAPARSCDQATTRSKVGSSHTGHLTYCRSVAKTMYGIPDDVELYAPGELDGTDGKPTKTERLQVRMTPELKAKLQQLAEAEGRTVSNYVELLIKKAIEAE